MHMFRPLPAVSYRALSPLLVSLLMAVAADSAQAGQTVRVGAAGAAGAPAQPPATGHGGDGVAGESVQFAIVSSEAYNALTLTGGHGGAGGDGYTQMPWPADDWPPPQGLGGAGGAGGAANGALAAQRARGAVSAATATLGGNGAQGGTDGCCMTGMGAGGTGGAATSAARAATGAGVARVLAQATGGSGGVSREGGAAHATAVASSAAGAASGQVIAQGGSGGSGRPTAYGLTFNPGAGGNASASLALAGTGTVNGAVLATGGDAGSAYTGWGQVGAADATIELRGAGATGSATAINGHGAGSAVATSVARAVTTGAVVVDITSTARGSLNSAGAASVDVDAGYSGAAAGNAAVTGRALATGGADYQASNSATLILRGNGAIIGVSEARGADGWDSGSCYNGCAGGASASSVATGATRGSGNVAITALAVGGAPNLDGVIPTGGGATAAASGQSGSGVVTVTARARSYSSYSSDEPFVNPEVRASAITTAAGGSSYAQAIQESLVPYGEYRVLAEASSVGKGGARAVATGISSPGGYGGMLESRASASGAGLTVSTYNQLWALSRDASVVSDVSVGGVLQGLPASDGSTALVSSATGLPAQADLAGLLGASPTLAATDASWLGAGAYAYSSNTMALVSTSETQYTFATADGQRLLVGLFGGPSQSGGDLGLNFSVSNNGTLLFTRSLLGDELTPFFTDRLLDLGLLGSGLQNLTIATQWYGSAFGGEAAGYGFRYVMGVSPVPEPSTWLAMLLGLGTLVMVARRRQA